ncbi:ABC transporter ATP-binding protein [Phormidium tenue FACHB-886]|nr:ABC transporter ATP-binding protein [Phormidium tenue FACHB-886]
MNPLLELRAISKSFGAVRALENITFSVNAGEIHCLLGENGAGKSTLCNLIFGVHQPSSGAIKLQGQDFRPTSPAVALQFGIAMVHQHFSLVPTLTAVENLMLGRVSGILQREAFTAKVKRLSAEFNIQIDFDRPIEELSVGDRQRLEILKCLIHNPLLLVLDEPTAVLPPEEIEALLQLCRRMVQQGCGVILVTHKLAEVTQIADRITVLRNGRIVSTPAADTADTHTLIQAMIGRDLRTINDAVSTAFGVEDTVSASKGYSTRVQQPVETKNALSVQDLSFRDRNGILRLNQISFSVQAGEIVGIAGVEGNGQTELGEILAGLEHPSSGQIWVGTQNLSQRSPVEITAAGVGIVPEDRHAIACIEDLSVSENLFLSKLDQFQRFGILQRRALTQAAQKLMTAFDVRAATPDAPMKSLSGGNQQKVVLARELSIQPLKFLLAAQPTRGLDVGAIDAIFSRLREVKHNGTGILLISSELDELLALSDRILVLYRGQIVGEMSAISENRAAIGALMSGHQPEKHLSNHSFIKE